MKRNLLLFLICCLCAITHAQNSGELKEYNRSSLATMMIFHPEDEFCKDIALVFDTMPMPDKYNEHSIYTKRFINSDAFYGLKKKNETYAWRSQDPMQLTLNHALVDTMVAHDAIFSFQYEYDEKLKKSYCDQLKLQYVEGQTSWDEVQAAIDQLADKDREKIEKKLPAKGLVKAKYGKQLDKGEVETNAKAIEKMLNDNQYAKRLIAKWFNFSGVSLLDAHFDMNLVSDRGNYNASEIDLAIAKQTARGTAMLADAGEELIGNTYVLVNDITYVTTEEKAAAGKTAAKVFIRAGNFVAGLFGLNLGSVADQLENAVEAIADAFTGFDVRIHSYLYRVVWDDETANMFYTQHYTTGAEPNKIMAFLNDSTTYRLEYVQHAYDGVERSTTKDVDRNEYIKFVCTRSMDANIATLQKNYEDFKVKTPIYEVTKDEKGKTIYTAKIGTKEGITESSSFQVVKKEIDPQTNRTKYRYVATIKPVKGGVWDNQYYVTGTAPEQKLTATHFQKVSGGEILTGMLIIEGKYRKAVD